MMDYTDMFTSEDDALFKLQMNSSPSRDYVCPSSSSRKASLPNQVFRTSLLAGKTTKTTTNITAAATSTTTANNTNNNNALMKSSSPATTDSEDGTNRLIDAISTNDVECVRKCLLSASGEGGRAALQMMQKSRRPENEGRTPLHVAVENGFAEITRLLLSTFPTFNVNTADNLGSTCLHKAATIGHTEIMKMLLERGAQVNIQDSGHGNSPLHEAAWKGYAQSVQLLCYTSRLPNLVNYALFTPLHLAVQGGHNQTTRNLIRCGADIAAQNRFGDTPLHTAVRYGHAGVSRILATVSSNMMADAAAAAAAGGGGGYNQFLQNNSVSLLDVRNQNGDCPLHIAAALKRRKITRLLLDAGASTNIRNLQSHNPLDVAQRKNHSEIIEILLNYSNASNCQSNAVARANQMPPPPHTSTNQQGWPVPNYASSQMTTSPGHMVRSKSQSPHQTHCQTYEPPSNTNNTTTIPSVEGDHKPPKKNRMMKNWFSRKKKKSKTRGEGDREEDFGTARAHSSSNPGQNDTQASLFGTPSRVIKTTSCQATPQQQQRYIVNFDTPYYRPDPVPPVVRGETCSCQNKVTYDSRGYPQQYSGNMKSRYTPSNVCLDHGYVDYHGPMGGSRNMLSGPRQSYVAGVGMPQFPTATGAGPGVATTADGWERRSCRINPYHPEQLSGFTVSGPGPPGPQHQGGSLMRTRSDESLNQSEHKARMKEERLRNQQKQRSPIKGRRVNFSPDERAVEKQQQQQQQQKQQQQQMIGPLAVQIPYRPNKGKFKGAPMSSTQRKTSASIAPRPSPDGQTDSLSTNCMNSNGMERAYPAAATATAWSAGPPMKIGAPTTTATTTVHTMSNSNSNSNSRPQHRVMLPSSKV